jgi:Glycosyltransferase
MKISILGTRGIPAKYGGFETFAEEISALLAEKGYDVTVQCDSESYSHDYYRGARLYFSSVSKSDHPLRYYFEGIRWATKNSDIILVASAAGSFFYFLNFFRKKLIITNPDGLEHHRRKWSPLKRLYLKISEALAVKLSSYIIADSFAIEKYLNDTYKSSVQKIRVIEYGAYLNRVADFSVLKKYGLTQNEYYLVVCRLERENNLEMICEAFQKALTSFTLVIVGNIENNSEYINRLVNQFSSAKIRFLDGIYDKTELCTLRYSCKAYIHGHSVGGTNPSLLEAMASRNVILAHDNTFNREVTSGNQLYFSTIGQCTKMINEIELMTNEEIEKYKEQSFNMISTRYTWDRILGKYLELFSEIKS